MFKAEDEMRVTPVYTGAAVVGVWLSDMDARNPALANHVGRGTLFSFHNGAGIVAQRNGGAAICVYAAFRTRLEDTDRPNRALAGITAAQLLPRFEGWAPSLLALIADADRIGPSAR